jgi:CDP-2,3-bis-(O-geranylgeranyl)-sn-glycerol synthase
MQCWQANELLLLLVAVNGMPVLVGILAGTWLDTPLDGGKVLRDGSRLFGPSKTLRGLAIGILAGALAAPLAGLDGSSGAAFGALSMLGDLGTSFVKRRLGYPSSDSRPLLDQLPECLLPMVMLKPLLDTGFSEILAATAAFTVLDLLITRFLRRLRPHAGDAG